MAMLGKVEISSSAFENDDFSNGSGPRNAWVGMGKGTMPSDYAGAMLGLCWGYAGAMLDFHLIPLRKPEPSNMTTCGPDFPTLCRSFCNALGEAGGEA